MTPHIVFKPVVTEKSLGLQEQNKYSFLVPNSANKNQVKIAFKFAFGFSPLKVQSFIQKGKKKTDWRKRKTFYQSNLKKVIITLPKDKKLDLLAVKK